MSSLKSSVAKKRFNIDIPSNLDFEKIPRVAVEIIAGKMGFDPGRIENLKTAIGEAVGNAIEHGNQKDVGARVCVELIVESDALMMRVIDQGLEPIPDIAVERIFRDDHRGWGLQWIKDFTDEAATQAKPGQNEITMIAYLNQET
jgi:serine/threonine-protein kinase RsbW